MLVRLFESVYVAVYVSVCKCKQGNSKCLGQIVVKFSVWTTFMKA